MFNLHLYLRLHLRTKEWNPRCRYAPRMGKENIITDRLFSLGGDDFAEYIIKVPGVYAYVGTGNENRPETCVAHHDCMFDIDEDSLPIMAGLYAAYSVAFLSGCIDTDK